MIRVRIDRGQIWVDVRSTSLLLGNRASICVSNRHILCSDGVSCLVPGVVLGWCPDSISFHRKTPPRVFLWRVEWAEMGVQWLPASVHLGVSFGVPDPKPSVKSHFVRQVGKN